MKVPFFRPSIGDHEIEQVVDCLRSGWLTTGQHVKSFEEEFARFVGAKYAVALNSCTAALHLALEAIDLRRGEVVIVPTMTFAATAEVVRYFDAIPVFVDCDETQGIDPVRARETLESLRAGGALPGLPKEHGRVRAIIPMHYGGQMIDVDAMRALATEYDLVVIEDAAHTLPAFTRSTSGATWCPVGTTADITCFSFYANKCITTGEGGMAVTDNFEYAERMRLMSLHGMSKDAWKRFTAAGSWQYEVIAPGFKYNLTDIAGALGRAQLQRANEFWTARKRIVAEYQAKLADIAGLGLPIELENRQHSWHLFSIRVDPKIWTKGRDAFIADLKDHEIGASVHWMPLHMQPYYRDTYGLSPNDFPVAAEIWPRLVTLPVFPSMSSDEIDYVVETIRAMSRAT
jgi:dTDP-4-amino-4,6-dideoxygalactose transaminase